MAFTLLVFFFSRLLLLEKKDIQTTQCCISAKSDFGNLPNNPNLVVTTAAGHGFIQDQNFFVAKKNLVQMSATTQWVYNGLNKKKGRSFCYLYYVPSFTLVKKAANLFFHNYCFLLLNHFKRMISKCRFHFLYLKDISDTP